MERKLRQERYNSFLIQEEFRDPMLLHGVTSHRDPHMNESPLEHDFMSGVVDRHLPAPESKRLGSSPLGM